MKTSYTALHTALLLCLISLATGCTLIRYVDPPEPEPPGPGPETKEIDVLVLVELDRSTVQLAEDYQTILGGLGASLLKSNIEVRKLAIAPLYKRSGGTVPLIYGEDDPDSEFSNYGEAIAFFAQDDGQKYLRNKARADGENLATLGLDLDSRTVYHPRTADTNARAYFTTPNDGFLVVQMTSRSRLCRYSDEACQLDQTNAANYFTRQGDNGSQWLSLPGGTSLPKERVFFINFATAEEVNEDAFVEKCSSIPQFNTSNLDYIEPSPVAYYGPLASEISNQGGWSKTIDMCDVMSPITGGPILGKLGSQIRGRLGR